MTNPSAGYRRTAVLGAATTGLSQGVKIVLQMLSAVILARLLVPADFGLVAMVGPIVAFVALFQDIGLQQAIIHMRQATAEQISRLFWVNMLMAVGVAVTVIIIAPFVAWFYGEPRVLMLTVAWALPILISCGARQHLTLLNRDLKFHHLAMIDVLASVVSLAGGVFVAWWTHSYWALWVAMLLSAIATFIASWIATGWRPMSPFVKADISPFVKFGINFAGFNILNYFARNADNVIIAKAFGPMPLGLYDRSYKLLLAPLSNINAPVSRVMQPILARLRDEPERYRLAYIRAASMVTWICVPGIAALTVTAHSFIHIMFGERWMAAAPIFAWLGVAGLNQPLSNTTGWLFLSQHRTREMFHWGLVGSSTTILSFIVGIPWGVTGIAASYALSSTFLRAPLLIWWVGRKGPVKWTDLALMLFPALAAGGLTFFFAHWVKTHMLLSPVADVFLALVFAYCCALLLILLVPATRRWLFSSLLIFLPPRFNPIGKKEPLA